MDEETAKKFAEIELRLTSISNQLELERQKTFQLMSAVVSNFDLKIVEANSPLSSIAPIEVSPGGVNAPILVFPSLVQSLGLPTPEFYRMSARYGQTVYFIKDHAQCWYQRGLIGLSHNIPGTVEVFKEILGESLPGLRTFGASAGGFAAILFGVMLQARKIVAFSPQTLLTARNITRFKSQDTRSGDVLHGTYLDLVPVIEQSQDCEIHIHYGIGYAEDAKAAERLRGLPNTVLHAHDFNGHNVAGWLKKNNKLDEALAPIFEGANVLA